MAAVTKRKPLTAKAIGFRNQRMSHARLVGDTLQAIADRENITKARAGAILQKLGVGIDETIKLARAIEQDRDDQEHDALVAEAMSGLPERAVSIADGAIRLGMSEQVLKQLCWKGCVPWSMKNHASWELPLKSIEFLRRHHPWLGNGFRGVFAGNRDALHRMKKLAATFDPLCGTIQEHFGDQDKAVQRETSNLLRKRSLASRYECAEVFCRRLRKIAKGRQVILTAKDLAKAVNDTAGGAEEVFDLLKQQKVLAKDGGLITGESN